MSLNLSFDGLSVAPVAITALSGITSAIFTNGDSPATSNKFIVKIDTTSGDINLKNLTAPNSLTFLKTNAVFTFIKSSTDNNRILFTDDGTGTSYGLTNIEYNFVNLQGEFINLIANKVENKWMMVF